MQYSVAELIDRLSIVNIKIWHLTDIVMNSKSDEEVAKAARGAENANQERRALMKDLNEILGSSSPKFDGTGKI